MIVARIVKDYDWPDIFRQTPGGRGLWDDIQFTVDPAASCDVVIMFNNRMKTDTTVTCPRENLWALMQEPYYPGLTDWMVEHHAPFARVFTHHLPSHDTRYVASHPANPWHVNRTYDQLMSAEPPVKSRPLSGIVGDAMDLPGHLKRKRFLEYIRRDHSLDLDLFGKKINFIEDKWDGLAPYRYSLAIENSCGPDYWTEKVADCFLTWTVPFYCGCTNLEEYFPRESFIRIDIERPEESLEKIKQTIEEDNWERHIPALEEARNLVLKRFQIFPHLTDLIRSWAIPDGTGEETRIPAYRRSAASAFNRAAYKFKKKLRLL